MGKAKGCAIGCAVAVGVLAVVIFIGFRLIVLRFGPAIGNITGKGGEVASILKDVGGMNAFTPPEDGMMKENRFVDFLEIRERTFAQTESFLSYLDRLDRRESTVRDALNFLDELGKIFLTRARGLKDKKMSSGEYFWYFQQIAFLVVASELKDAPEKVRGVIDADRVLDRIRTFSERLKHLESSGGGYDRNTDIQKGWKDFRAGLLKDRQAFNRRLRSMPEENIRMIHRYRDRILKTAVLFLFGL